MLPLAGEEDALPGHEHILEDRDRRRLAALAVGHRNANGEVVRLHLLDPCLGARAILGAGIGIGIDARAGVRPVEPPGSNATQCSRGVGIVLTYRAANGLLHRRRT
ncbi:MAG: hypothetical protein ABIR98_14215 [Usitatibacter sp.]